MSDLVERLRTAIHPNFEAADRIEELEEQAAALKHKVKYQDEVIALRCAECSSKFQENKKLQEQVAALEKPGFNYLRQAAKITHLLAQVAALEKELDYEIILPIGGTSKYECPHCKELQKQVAALESANRNRKEVNAQMLMNAAESGNRNYLAEIEQLQEQVAALETRCYPSKVILIGDTGHYVSELVHKRIKDLEAKIAALEALNPDELKIVTAQTLKYYEALKQEEITEQDIAETNTPEPGR